MNEVDEVEELQDLQEVDFEGNNEKLVETFIKPKVVMCFNSPDKMFEHYKAYGQQEDFPVIRKSCKK